MLTRFRKKPVVIDARQLTADNVLDLFHWCNGKELDDNPSSIVIKTMEGNMTASEGDWIIRGIKGEFYPCKPDIFAATYEPADAASECRWSRRGKWFSKLFCWRLI